jgi:hypothetical protein
MCAPTLPADHLASTSTFKASDWRVTVLTGERKFQGSFEFVPFATAHLLDEPLPPKQGCVARLLSDAGIVVPFDAVIDPRVSGFQTSRQGSLKLGSCLESSIERLRYSLA